MKKVFPILPYLEDDDIIVIVDDDLVIPSELLETRLKEFDENGRRCAISGGTNPRWHLNRKFLCVKVNVVTPTSLFQKKMLNGYDKMLCDELIQTYNDDFIYTLLITMNGYQIVPSKYISSRTGIVGKIVNTFNEFHSMRAEKAYKPDADVIKLFVKRYERVYGIPLNSVLETSSLFL